MKKWFDLGVHYNQGTLSEDVSLYFEDKYFLSKSGYHQDYDKGHGRIETRKCYVSNNVQWLKERHPDWLSIKSILRVESIREIKGNASTEIRYYISSLDAEPSKMLSSIRSP
jgi:hypothetical protein